MRRSYDAILLGAGIAGLSAARELAQRGKRVLLLERDEVVGKTSRAAAGILDPYTEASEESPLLELGVKAFDFYPSFLEAIQTLHGKQVEWEKPGLLYLALTPEDETFLQRRFEWQKKRGLQVEPLSAEEVRKFEPLASPQARSGVYYPEISKLNPAKLVDALLSAARSAGVEIQTSVKNVSVWIEREKVRGVRISESPVESPLVVLATGSWAGLHKKLGIKIKVKPVRGQILLLRAAPSRTPRHILHSIRWAYVIPWPRHRLLIGSTLESAGFDDQVTTEGTEDILNRVSEMMEGVRDLPIESSWSGLRPYAEGGAPLIGPTDVSGLFLALGYYRSGILIGPWAGKLLAEGMISGTFSPLLRPFYPGAREVRKRFPSRVEQKRNRRFTMNYGKYLLIALLAGGIGMLSQTSAFGAPVENLFSTKGTVTQIDQETQTLRVKNEGGLQLTFHTDTTTRVLAGDELKTLAGLSTGDTIEIEYAYNENYEKVARSIKKTVPVPGRTG